MPLYMNTLPRNREGFQFMMDGPKYIIFWHVSGNVGVQVSGYRDIGFIIASQYTEPVVIL